MTIKILNKINAFAKGKKVTTVISVPEAKTQSVDKYKKLYGNKAIYKKGNIQYVKPFIKIYATSMMEI
tara:strand:+ start:176 stop:379 length:204 start_codon:yes stop_codon:yes gene_type:complete